MNEQELRDYMAARKPSPHAKEGLACFGCAHSSALDGPPGRPSGERPCCSCIRNPEREEWARDRPRAREIAIVVDNEGNARCFDPFEGTQYNGVPLVYHPSDRYRTLDGADQDDWLAKHPEYQGAVATSRDGGVRVIKD